MSSSPERRIHIHINVNTNIHCSNSCIFKDYTMCRCENIYWKDLNIVKSIWETMGAKEKWLTKIDLWKSSGNYEGDRERFEFNGVFSTIKAIYTRNDEGWVLLVVVFQWSCKRITVHAKLEILDFTVVVHERFLRWLMHFMGSNG